MSYENFEWKHEGTLFNHSSSRETLIKFCLFHCGVI